MRYDDHDRVAEMVAAINATLPCHSCGAAAGVECRTDCPLWLCSRVFEPCEECDRDVRLCDCFMRYEPPREARDYEREGDFDG